MERVTIFGRPSCGFCVRAKQLCEIKELPFRFINMLEEGISKADLAQTIGKPVQTVPQIFVGDQHVGGYTEFSAFLRQQTETSVS
ncbi:GrxA family glutaredoxin [Marinobacter sp. SS21]|uniref:GrxA family glutaredoxin n=1 Tax=Marinobacter sp. SS21 TaxID=2979460 RepID=UPI00232CD8F3|nr:GrxA family glutaredoxin [Marinobacter sp. SS21]MDC0664031.1 GrxA family glutaredoxin [Marinobacter sp. SS21]